MAVVCHTGQCCFDHSVSSGMLLHSWQICRVIFMTEILESFICLYFLCMSQEAEKYRSEYNKLRYDFTFLKSEFDHQRQEHERILEEQRIRYSADVRVICLLALSLALQFTLHLWCKNTLVLIGLNLSL